MLRLLGSLACGDVRPLRGEAAVSEREARQQRPFTATRIERLERDRPSLGGGAAHLALEHRADDVRIHVPQHATDRRFVRRARRLSKHRCRGFIDEPEAPFGVVHHERVPDALEHTLRELLRRLGRGGAIRELFGRLLELLRQRLRFLELLLQLDRL